MFDPWVLHRGQGTAAGRSGSTSSRGLPFRLSDWGVSDAARALGGERRRRRTRRKWEEDEEEEECGKEAQKHEGPSSARGEEQL